MAIPTWPTALFQVPVVTEYEEGWRPQYQMMTAGNKTPLTRRNTTLKLEFFKCTFIFDKLMLAIFEEFFYNSLKGGSLRFSWVHPRKKTYCECSIYGSSQDSDCVKVTSSEMKGVFWKVEFQVIIWP